MRVPPGGGVMSTLVCYVEVDIDTERPHPFTLQHPLAASNSAVHIHPGKIMSRRHNPSCEGPCDPEFAQNDVQIPRMLQPAADQDMHTDQARSNPPHVI